MLPALTIKDIEDWLTENQHAFAVLKAQPFPPLDNALYFLYHKLETFMGFYAYAGICHQAVQELKRPDTATLPFLRQWCRKYEILGTEDLVLFEPYYTRWEEAVRTDRLKIHKGLYVGKAPFAGIICFCQVFGLLYWDWNIVEVTLSAQEEQELGAQLKSRLRSTP